jgi:hypothetical protein
MFFPHPYRLRQKTKDSPNENISSDISVKSDNNYRYGLLQRVGSQVLVGDLEHELSGSVQCCEILE